MERSRRQEQEELAHWARKIWHRVQHKLGYVRMKPNRKFRIYVTYNKVRDPAGVGRRFWEATYDAPTKLIAVLQAGRDWHDTEMAKEPIFGVRVMEVQA